MESISRDVKSLESDERQLYEAVVGHALRENQRIVIHVIDLEREPDESRRGKAMEEFHAICKEGTENRQRQGIPMEEADQIFKGALRVARSQKTDRLQIDRPETLR
jgi:hypothetical protein